MEDIFAFIGEFFKAIFALLIIVVISSVILWVVSSIFHVEISSYHYEYIDVDGNTGIADNCWADSGAAYCKSGDMTIQVKNYTRIKEN